VTTDDAHGYAKGDPLFGVPAHMLNARLRWQVTQALDATLGGQYRSSRHRPASFHEPHLGGNAQGAAEVLGDFHGYNLLNMGATYRLTDRVQLNGSIENLPDKNFVDYRPYTLRNNPDVTAFSNVYNNILEPRRLWLALRASL
jgi:outer membrane receptor for ferrienterochelin and colicins